jgi:toxin FitB
VDALIAATAKAHDWTLVTRNTRDFEHSDVRVPNPFTG